MEKSSRILRYIVAVVVLAAWMILSCSSVRAAQPFELHLLEVLQRLQERGIQMYRTDLQGTVILYSDGSSVWSDQEPLPCAVREELADAVRARLNTQSELWSETEV